MRDDETPLSEPFWIFETLEEQRVVISLLRRRFPETFSIITEGLEEADPLEVVYPGNPDEYSDVVAEVIVLLAPEHGSLGNMSSSRLEEVVREGLARRFGETPDDGRVSFAVQLMLDRFSRISKR